MRIAILQPGYLPWLGFFEQMARVDHFVYYDDVQYTRKDWRNRNRIKAANGVTWLTVPVKKAPRAALIRDIEVCYRQPWQERHLRTIELAYGKAPYFEHTFAMLSDVLQRKYALLVDLNEAVVAGCCALLGIATPVSRSSELAIGEGDRNRRILAVCEALGTNELYDGAKARDFLDLDLFATAGVRVAFQNYDHPVYPQQWGPFVSHLSIIDLLMNAGPQSLAILTGDSEATKNAQDSKLGINEESPAIAACGNNRRSKESCRLIAR